MSLKDYFSKNESSKLKMKVINEPNQPITVEDQKYWLIFLASTKEEEKLCVIVPNDHYEQLEKGDMYFVDLKSEKFIQSDNTEICMYSENSLIKSYN